MKCEEFERSVRELARHQLFGELMEAGLRAAATTHAQECATCTARLANARSLSEGLRSLALSTEADQAPAHLEAALLAAFRQPAAGQVVSLAAVRTRKQWPVWALAAAAVLLVGLVGYAMRATVSRPVQPASPDLAIGNEPAPLKIEQIKKVLENTTAHPLEPGVAQLNASSAKHTNVGKPVLASVKRPAQRYRIERYLVESEIATDFLPLTDNAEVPSGANLQTIRVEVPRVMLSRFGLPMSFERAAEPVKADLLIGPDGQTRAIRFVQTEFEQPQIISANRDQ